MLGEREIARRVRVQFTTPCQFRGASGVECAARKVSPYGARNAMEWHTAAGSVENGIPYWPFTWAMMSKVPQRSALIGVR